MRTNHFGAVIHHTDTKDIETARNVLHRRGLSTNIIIDKDGSTHYEMPVDKMAAACVGLNKWMVQIDVVGRFEVEDPTLAQICSLKTVLINLAGGRKFDKLHKAELCRRMTNNGVRMHFQKQFAGLQYNLRKNPDAIADIPFYIVMHGEVRPTLCPGKGLRAEIVELREELINESERLQKSH